MLHLKKKYKNTLSFNPMTLLPSITPYHTPHTHIPHTHTTQVTELNYFGQFTAELLFLRKQSAGRGISPGVKGARDAAAHNPGPDKSLSLVDLHFLKFGSGMEPLRGRGIYRDKTRYL